MNSLRSSLPMRGAALLAALGMTFCQAETGSVNTGDAAAEERDPNLVSYGLDWAGTAVETTAEGWQVSTDRGHVVEVIDGFVAGSLVQLVPCADALARWRPSKPSLGFGVRRAAAGHDSDYVDSSALELIDLEPLMPTSTVADAGDGYGWRRYCAGAYEIAPAHHETVLDDGTDVAGLSLWLVVRLHDAPDQRRDERTLHSELTIRKQQTLPAAVNLSDGPVQVRVTRTLASLFDGIDFDTVSDREAGDRAAQNLVQSTSIEAHNG